MNVYELTEEYKRLDELLGTIAQMKADGEEGLEQFEADTLANFAALQDAIGDKMDNIGKLIKNLESEASAKKTEATRLADSAKRIMAKIDYLKVHLVKPMLETTEGKKLHGDLFAFSLRRSEAVKITDEGDIPSKYMIEKSTLTPDKKGLKDAIKSGERIVGAELVENFTVQIK